MDTYGELLMMLAFLLAGGIEKIIHSQVNFLFSLYALGALLSYTAVLCSIPTKEEKDHE